MQRPSSPIDKVRRAFARWGLVAYAYCLVFWALAALPFYAAGWGIWSLLGFPMLAAVLLALAYALGSSTGRSGPAVPVFDPALAYSIDYAARNGVQYRHGALWFADAAGHGTWQTDDGESSGTLEVALAEGDFRALWDGARGLSELGQYELAGPASDVDTEGRYVIDLRCTGPDASHGVRYAIPHGCQSPHLMDWVNAISHTDPIASALQAAVRADAPEAVVH